MKKTIPLNELNKIIINYYYEKYNLSIFNIVLKNNKSNNKFVGLCYDIYIPNGVKPKITITKLLNITDIERKLNYHICDNRFNIVGVLQDEKGEFDSIVCDISNNQKERQMEVDKMIIDNNKLAHMVKNYIMLGSREYNMQLARYELTYDREIHNFKFCYALRINDKEINCKQIIFKNELLNIINYFVSDEYHKANDYSVLNDDVKEFSLKVSLKAIDQKQKVKGERCEF